MPKPTLSLPLSSFTDKEVADVIEALEEKAAAHQKQAVEVGDFFEFADKGDALTKFVGLLKVSLAAQPAADDDVEASPALALPDLRVLYALSASGTNDRVAPIAPVTRRIERRMFTIDASHHNAASDAVLNLVRTGLWRMNVNASGSPRVAGQQLFDYVIERDLP